MAVHVLYKSLYISLSPLRNINVKRPNLALPRERERRRLIFLIAISNVMLCSIFSLEIVLTNQMTS